MSETPRTDAEAFEWCFSSNGDETKYVEAEFASKLERALEESVKLQSHYAELLNMHDGGERLTFTVESWLERLAIL